MTSSILGSILNLKSSSQDLEWRINMLETGQGLVWCLPIEYRKRKRIITSLSLGAKSQKWRIYKEGNLGLYNLYFSFENLTFADNLCKVLFVVEGLLSMKRRQFWGMGWIWKRGFGVLLRWNNYLKDGLDLKKGAQCLWALMEQLFLSDGLVSHRSLRCQHQVPPPWLTLPLGTTIITP